MRNTNTESGITLLHILVMIIIAGIGLAAAAQLATVQFQKEREEKITKSFENINDLLLAHYIDDTKKRLPCPAKRNIGIDHPDFGKEDCAGALIIDSDQTHPSTGNPLRVMIGALPVSELSLAHEDAFDVFGGQFIYAVSESMTVSANYGITNLSAVRFLDPSNLSQKVGIAIPFVVVSAGDSGQGTYNTAGTLIAACPSASTPESANCDGDYTFLNTDISEGQNATTFYDDRIGFDQNFAAQVANSIISNATCPTGEYLTGIQEGIPNCEAIDIPTCPTGEFLTGITDGQPVCESGNQAGEVCFIPTAGGGQISMGNCFGVRRPDGSCQSYICDGQAFHGR